MTTITERIIEVFRAREWDFEVDEDCDFVMTGVRGDNAQWRIRAGGITEITAAILSCFPVDCPEPGRNACAEVLTRINFAQPGAWFEMDYADGCIFCKTIIPYDQNSPAVELLDLMLSINMRTMDYYLPAIMAVIYAGLAPAKAVADLEKVEAQAAKPKPRRPKPTAPGRFQIN